MVALGRFAAPARSARTRALRTDVDFRWQNVPCPLPGDDRPTGTRYRFYSPAVAQSRYPCRLGHLRYGSRGDVVAELRLARSVGAPTYGRCVLSGACRAVRKDWLSKSAHI
jgi:hypothetical protein